MLPVVGVLLYVYGLYATFSIIPRIADGSFWTVRGHCVVCSGPLALLGVGFLIG